MNVYRQNFDNNQFETPELIGIADDLQYVCNHLNQYGFTDEELQTLTYVGIDASTIYMRNEAGIVFCKIYVSIE